MTTPLSIGFVLPASGGGGGANSIVQEALGLSRWGCAVSIFVNQGNLANFRRNYPELLPTDVQLAGFEDPASLAALLASVRIACATTALSVRTLADALAAIPRGGAKPLTAYYVQDYEPLFFEHGTANWQEAFDSYSLVPGMQLFAKTDWICEMVEQNHGVSVARVQASIDHDIYYPDFSRPRAEVVTIAAMLRPKTKRRAPFRTARILAWLAEEFGDRVQLEVFGTPDSDLVDAGVPLLRAAFNHGHLRRTEVPHLLRRADLFLDLSDYQAFGRTGLEAMASGCTPVVPVLGGSAEYAVHGWNAFVVDTRSDHAIKQAIRDYMAMSAEGRDAVVFAGLETATRFSTPRAVASEIQFFATMGE